MHEFIRSLPKAELHIHIEGSLEPQMLLDLAKRNHISIPYPTLEHIHHAYNFSNLQSFLDIYYQGMSVLQTEQDYYDLMLAYLRKASQDNVVYTEVFFDPQAHTQRGIGWSVFMAGFRDAISEAKQQFGIEAKLILCFLRHLPESDAFATLEAALDYRDQFIGVGLDSTEVGFPPRLFKQVFAAAGKLGLHKVAHAGEEAPPSYIWEAIDILGVERIDHGNRACEDKELVKRLAQDQIPLTMCPLSNLRLKNVIDLRRHQLRELLEHGVMVTINSDDPAYFGGYINQNYTALAKNLHLTPSELTRIAEYSLAAGFKRSLS